MSAVRLRAARAWHKVDRTTDLHHVTACGMSLARKWCIVAPPGLDAYSCEACAAAVRRAIREANDARLDRFLKDEMAVSCGDEEGGVA